MTWREDGEGIVAVLMACLQEFFLESSLYHHEREPDLGSGGLGQMRRKIPICLEKY